MPPRYPTLFSIAGFDPSGGAGVLLDIRVFESLGFHGAAVLTALTVQNTGGVAGLRVLPAAYVRRQFRNLRDDLEPAGIKVGMLGGAANLRAAAAILGRSAGVPRVVDPVLRSTSGALLLRGAGGPALLAAFRGRAELITPNLDEAALLSGRPVRDPLGMAEAAAAIAGRSGIPCLVKGGHLRGRVVDILHDGRTAVRFEREKLRREVRGTGCFLSAAVLAFLAAGEPLESACRRAGDLTHRAIREAVRPGRGARVFRMPAPAAVSGRRARPPRGTKAAGPGSCRPSGGSPPES